MSEDKTAKHRTTILQLYAVFLIAMVALFLPYMAAQVISLIFLLTLFIVVPVYQYVAPENSLLENHMQYLNRTLWAGTTLLLLCILVLGFWVYTQSDQSAFDRLFYQLNNGFMVDEAQLKATLEEFMAANTALLMQASMICLGPPLVYMFYRILRALERARGGYRMPNARGWF